MAEHTCEALKLFETAHFASKPAGSACNTFAYTSAEPGTIRLIRTACKAFEQRGDEKSGCPLQFTSFLRSRGIQTVPLAHFRGNRFNIIYHNGGGIYYLHRYIQEFLESTWGVPNNLLKAVLVDVKKTMYIAGCKALGLIDYHITSPLWKLLESDMHIFDMCQRYSDLHTFLCRERQDASGFMTGEDIPFRSAPRKMTSVVEVLLDTNPEIDGLVQSLLQAIFQTLELLIERVVHEWRCEWRQSRSAQPILSVRETGKLDRYVREKPNAKLLALETHIMFTNNKTASWLDSKSEKGKKVIFAKARDVAPQHQVAFRKKRKAIEAGRQEVLANKQVEIERQRRKVRGKGEVYKTNGRIWALAKCGRSEKKTA